MRRSGKKILVIILIVIAVLLLAGGGFAYAYFCTDIFRTGQELFVKYLTQDLEEIGQTLSWEKFNEINDKIEQSRYEEKMTVSYLEEKQTKPTAELTIDTQKDNIDGKSYMHMSLMSKELENALQLEYLQEDDAHSVKFTSISKGLDFITVENKNLKKLAENLGVDKADIEEIPNRIDFEELSGEGLAFSEAEKKEEINKYISLIYNTIPKEKYTKNKDVVITVNGKTITTNSYVLALSEQDIKNLVIKALEELKKDEIILSRLNILLEKFQNLDATMEELDEEALKENYEEAIQQLIDGLKEEKVTDENKITITVYEEAGKTARIKLEQGMDYITLDTTEAEGNKQIDINFTSIDEDNTQLSYKVTFVKESDNKRKVQFTNIDGEEQEVLEFNIELSETENETKIDYNIINNEENKISLSREIKFVDELEYKVELDESNNIILNNLTKEQMETIFGILEPRLNSSYLEKLEPLSEDVAMPMVALPIVALVVAEPETAVGVVPVAAVLISYNTFKGAQESVMSTDLSEAEMTQFNSKFTMYEGTNVSAPKVNALLMAVNSHNMEESLEGTEMYVTVSGLITLTEEDATIPEVEIDKNYKVVCKYKDGLVNEIVIVNPEDEIPGSENNEESEEGTNDTLEPVISENSVFPEKGKDAIANTDLSEAERAQFNSKFTMYEGENVSTARVNAMLNAVFAHNNQEKAAGTKNYVTVTGKVELDENADHIDKISGSNYYKVVCEYEDGIVTKIIVTEKN